MPSHASAPDAAPLTELDSLVFSGAYEQVLSRTAAAWSDADAPAVVGALALSGRLDEAESVFEARLRGRGAVARAATLRARFFLVAGLCHAGNAEKALRHARESASHILRGPANERYWACQGLALVRHFEGRLGRARRVARRALGAALEADFPYGRFLSLDLLAHVAVQVGEIHAGMRLLAQAGALADSLGYADNAATERAAALIFQLRFSAGVRETALSEVSALVNASGVSYFTRRNGLLELASAHALRGEHALARAALDDAQRIALPGTDRRARVRWLSAHALCMALSRGAAEARASLREAKLLGQGQHTLRAEVAFVELIFCGPATPAALLEVEQLAAWTGAERARVAWLVAAGEARAFPPGVEDGLCRLLLECVPLSPPERLHRIVEARLLGLAPWALGLEPARRLVLMGTRLIVEDQGHVSLRELKHRPELKLLLELRRGYRSRAELLRDVWSIGHFVPARHLPTLHTAMSRLRFAIGEGDWVLTHDDGYSLAPRVEVLLLDAPGSLGQQELDAPFTSTPTPSNDRERVVDFITEHGASSSAEVARALRLSSSTVQRLVRQLSADGLLERQGGGRSTRYRRLPK